MTKLLLATSPDNQTDAQSYFQRALLNTAYARSTEGFTTRDLKLAKALLEDL